MQIIQSPSELPTHQVATDWNPPARVPPARPLTTVELWSHIPRVHVGSPTGRTAKFEFATVKPPDPMNTYFTSDPYLTVSAWLTHNGTHGESNAREWYVGAIQYTDATHTALRYDRLTTLMAPLKKIAARYPDFLMLQEVMAWLFEVVTHRQVLPAGYLVRIEWE